MILFIRIIWYKFFTLNSQLLKQEDLFKQTLTKKIGYGIFTIVVACLLSAIGQSSEFCANTQKMFPEITVRNVAKEGLFVRIEQEKIMFKDKVEVRKNEIFNIPFTSELKFENSYKFHVSLEQGCFGYQYHTIPLKLIMVDGTGI